MGQTFAPGSTPWKGLRKVGGTGRDNDACTYCNQDSNNMHVANKDLCDCCMEIHAMVIPEDLDCHQQDFLTEQRVSELEQELEDLEESMVFFQQSQ